MKLSILNTTPSRALAIAIALALGGCASAPSLTPEARSHYDTTAKALAQNGTALLVDTCSYRLEVGTSHVYPQRSDAHAKLFAQASAQFLEARSVKVLGVYRPVLCTDFEKEKLLDLKKASAPGAELQAIDTYPLRGADAALPAEQEALVMQLWQAVHKLPPTNDRSLDAPIQAQPLNITPEQGKALSSLLGARYVWLIDNKIQDVSMGRAIGMVALTSALTFGLSGGAMASWSTNEDAIGEHTTLVDLDQQTALWRRQVSTVARNLVDFERPLPDASLMKNWAETSAFVPFYEAAVKQ